MTKSITTAVIAEALNARLIGRGDMLIARVAHPADIHDARDLAMATDANLVPLLANGVTRAAVVSNDSKVDPASLGMEACIIVDRSRLAMAKLTHLFAEPVHVPPGIHPTAFIESGAIIGANVTIGAFTYICAGAVIGDNSVLHPQVYIGPNAQIGREALIYSGTRIGANVIIGDRFIIHFNSSVGADGFSFVTPQPGSVEEAKKSGTSTVSAANTELVRIASLGTVIIGDDCEVGANSSIDRGTIAATRIGRGTKIDNQVQIGHNVVVGENCLLCGRVGIAGSAVIGNRVVLGGASGVADHVKIGDDAVVMAMAGVAGNVQPRTIVGGFPAAPREQIVQNMLNVGRIRQLIKKIGVLTERVDKIEKG